MLCTPSDGVLCFYGNIKQENTSVSAIKSLKRAILERETDKR